MESKLTKLARYSAVILNRPRFEGLAPISRWLAGIQRKLQLLKTQFHETRNSSSISKMFVFDFKKYSNLIIDLF